MEPAVDRPVVRVVTTRDRAIDAATAGALLLAATLSVVLSIPAGSTPPPAWALVMWAAVLTLPLAWRRVAPCACALVVVPTFLAGQAAGIPEYLVSQIAPFVALYSVGAWSAHRRRALVVRAVLVAVIVALLVAAAVSLGDRIRSGVTFAPGGAVALSALSTALYLVAALAFGETAWRSAMRRAALERRTAELQEERERSARRAVAVERLRIARELHDVVAHRVSVIGVQAGAARRVLRSAPDDAAAALGAVEESARLAIDDLRSTVVALRDPEAEEDPGASTIGLAALPQLVEEARRTGTAVELTCAGDPAGVPAATALALYRVAQEALTNVRKHAGAGAAARVDLVIGPEQAELTVTDRGGTPDGARAPGTGMGLTGMRERMGAAGGVLESGPEPGGYRVRAVVPVRP